MKKFSVLIIAFLLFFTPSCFFYKTQEEIEDAISKSESASRVNKLCQELPKPEDFRFVQKEIGGNSNFTALAFFYISNKKISEIKEFYNKWAEQNGWIILKESGHLEESRYEKGNQGIVIEFQPLGDANVIITCKEKR